MGPVRANYIVQLIAAFLTGCFVGTFVGLATSPVAHLVISALIGLCAAATAAIAGVQAPNDEESKPEQPKLLFKFHNAQVDFIPITLLAAGLPTGSCVGVVVRTNDVLGMHPNGYPHDGKIRRSSMTKTSREDSSIKRILRFPLRRQSKNRKLRKAKKSRSPVETAHWE